MNDNFQISAGPERAHCWLYDIQRVYDLNDPLPLADLSLIN